MSRNRGGAAAPGPSPGSGWGLGKRRRTPGGTMPREASCSEEERACPDSYKRKVHRKLGLNQQIAKHRPILQPAPDAVPIPILRTATWTCLPRGCLLFSVCPGLEAAVVCTAAVALGTISRFRVPARRRPAGTSDGTALSAVPCSRACLRPGRPRPAPVPGPAARRRSDQRARSPAVIEKCRRGGDNRRR